MSVKKGLFQSDCLVLDWLELGNFGSAKEIADALDMKKTTVYSALQRLSAEGMAEIIEGRVDCKTQVTHIWGIKEKQKLTGHALVMKALEKQPDFVKAWHPIPSGVSASAIGGSQP